MKKVSFYRKMLLFVNCPLLVGLPLLLHSSVFASLSSAKLHQMNILLSMADCVLFIDSLLIYTIIGKIVTSINYKPESDKVEVTHLGTTFLSPKTETLNPKDLAKHKYKTVNPFIGYKRLDTKTMFATESSIGHWNDRKFFDSIISAPVIK